jgi:hypothetical protein
VISMRMHNVGHRTAALHSAYCGFKSLFEINIRILNFIDVLLIVALD